MSVDRRSFKLGLGAGVILIIGLVLGVALTARMDWVTPALSLETNNKTPTSTGSAPANFAPVVKAAIPAVVNISTTRVVRSRGGEEGNPFDDPMFRHFFGDEFSKRFQIPKDRRENSLGSGVIVSADGYIVTNNHVIAKADKIKVMLNDKREFTGEVVGTDPKTDLAVIKIGAKNLPTIPWADSDKADVGEFVLAMGNPFGLNQTVTLGIVSAVGRANIGITDYEDFIQTDVAINPGNSGGALVNARGELLGINTAIFSRSGGYQGVGFAVPANMVKSVMESLIKGGKVVRGWLGVGIQDVTPQLAKQFGLSDAKGALVNKIMSGTPAAKAGMKKGDVITAYNGKSIDNTTALRNAVAQTTVGKTIKVQVLRDKKPLAFDIKIAEQPKDLAKAGMEDEEADVDNGKEEAKAESLSGVKVETITADIARQLGLPTGTTGVLVSEVVAGSAAESAGLQRGDVIQEINRTAVRSVSDFKKVTGKLNKKDNILLSVSRRGNELYLAIEP